MSKRWRLHRSARSDIDEAVAWYEERDAGLGIAFAETVEARLRDAEQRPGIATLVGIGGEPYRRLAVRGYPCSIWVLELTEGYLVLAVLHTRRNAAYWLRRAERARER